MGIKEKDLQTIESLSDGDKLRVVTKEGASRSIDAGSIGSGGGIMICSPTLVDGEVKLNKSYNDLSNALKNNIIPFYIHGANNTMRVFNLSYLGKNFTGEYLATFYVEQSLNKFSATDPDELMGLSNE